MAQAAQSVRMGRGIGVAGVLALAILVAAVTALAWLALSGRLERLTSGTPIVVLDLPPLPAAAKPAAAVPQAPAAPAALPEPQAPAQTAATPPAATAPAAAPAAPQEAALPAWRRFARLFPAADPRPRIAIVVTGLGLNEGFTLSAIERLPPEVTLSFSPYTPTLPELIEAAYRTCRQDCKPLDDLREAARQAGPGADRKTLEEPLAAARKAGYATIDRMTLPELMAAARRAGHEVLLDLPMEPRTYPNDDPGPQALLTSLDGAENQRRLDWVLGRGQEYVGVASYMGSRFTADADKLRPVLQTLAGRGLLFLDSRYGADTTGPRLAGDLKMPHAENDRFLDSEPSRAAIDARLEQLERQARAKSPVVAMALPYPVTIDRLSAWAQTLAGKGIALAPISAAATQP